MLSYVRWGFDIGDWCGREDNRIKGNRERGTGNSVRPKGARAHAYGGGFEPLPTPTTKAFAPVIVWSELA